MAESPKKPGADAIESRESRGRERAADFEWLHRASTAAREPSTPERHESRPGASTPAVICDLGGLDDVVEMLGGIGERPLRVRPEELLDLQVWEQPTRLFVTTVGIAHSHEHVLGPLIQGVTSIVVAESDTQTLSAAMLRRGFRYVVSRPVHPEALRLLLLQILFRGRDHRGVARFPFGAEVRWRDGFKRGRCAMTEISAHGCRLLTNERFPIGGRIRLIVPSVLPAARPLRLRGEVVRRDLGDPKAGRPFRQVAVEFEGLSARTRAHLDALLAERASGPAQMDVDGQAIGEPASPRRGRRGRSRFLSLTKSSEAEWTFDDVLREASAPDVDRRRRPRAVWQSEVVALGDSERALCSLMGSDLSTGGMRVEPHPLLRLGDRLNLALFDARQAEPLQVVACVARDDGPQGWGLIFESLDEACKAHLESMVAALPPVCAVDGESGEPEGVVLGEIRLLKVPAKKAR